MLQCWDNLLKMGSMLSETQFNTLIMSSLPESYRLTLQTITAAKQASSLTSSSTQRMKASNLIDFLIDEASHCVINDKRAKNSDHALMDSGKKVLCFCNSCQLCLCLCLSCDFLSKNSVPRHTTVGYHIIFVPLFTWTFLWDSPSYSQVLPYVNTILSSSVDINPDYLLYISTLNFAFQGMGMHRTIFTIYHMFISCLRNSL